MPDFSCFSDDCRSIRQKSPIIHNITNYVAMSSSANALLSVGASPVMSSEPAEMEDIASCADALVVNMGCIGKSQFEAMKLSSGAMHRLGKPWVLDPVGVGMSRFRHDAAMTLIEEFRPSVIRGNASEIMALCSADAPHHGVDSSMDSLVVAPFADALAAGYGVVVSVSGAVDYITDGKRKVKLSNGSGIMSRVTAMGCISSALTAAFLSVRSDTFLAAAHSMALVGVAGEIASSRCSGPGSFYVSFIDTLATLDTAEAYSIIRYE